MVNQEKKYLQLKDVRPYIISRELSKIVWDKVLLWEYLAIKTIGDQFIRSTDSIGANIAEGFGRFHKKDKIKFYYNARGSVYESLHWVDIAYERKLITEKVYREIIEKLKKLPTELNHFIKVTNEKLTI